VNQVNQVKKVKLVEVFQVQKVHQVLQAELQANLNTNKLWSNKPKVSSLI
jgi:hypothetical protein